MKVVFVQTPVADWTSTSAAPYEVPPVLRIEDLPTDNASGGLLPDDHSTNGSAAPDDLDDCNLELPFRSTIVPLAYYPVSVPCLKQRESRVEADPLRNGSNTHVIREPPRSIILKHFTDRPARHHPEGLSSRSVIDQRHPDGLDVAAIATSHPVTKVAASHMVFAITICYCSGARKRKTPIPRHADVIANARTSLRSHQYVHAPYTDVEPTRSACPDSAPTMAESASRRKLRQGRDPHCPRWVPPVRAASAALARPSDSGSVTGLMS